MSLLLCWVQLGSAEYVPAGLPLLSGEALSPAHYPASQCCLALLPLHEGAT